MTPLTEAALEELSREDARIRELWRGTGKSHMLPERTDDEDKELSVLLRKQHDAAPALIASARRCAELERDLDKSTQERAAYAMIVAAERGDEKAKRLLESLREYIATHPAATDPGKREEP